MKTAVYLLLFMPSVLHAESTAAQDILNGVVAGFLAMLTAAIPILGNYLRKFLEAKLRQWEFDWATTYLDEAVQYGINRVEVRAKKLEAEKSEKVLSSETKLDDAVKEAILQLQASGFYAKVAGLFGIESVDDLLKARIESTLYRGKVPKATGV